MSDATVIGRTAYESGKQPGANPYDKGTETRDEWDAGWWKGWDKAVASLSLNDYYERTL